MCSCLSHTLVICPDRESNRRSFRSQASTQSTEPDQPELSTCFYVMVNNRHNQLLKVDTLLLVLPNTFSMFNRHLCTALQIASLQYSFIYLAVCPVHVSVREFYIQQRSYHVICLQPSNIFSQPLFRPSLDVTYGSSQRFCSEVCQLLF